MGTLTRFEDIEAWQKAREMVRAVYAITRNGSFSRDFGLRDQIRRAAVSVMANIAEGFGREGTGEFAQFLSVAKGSVSEVESHLYVALDEKYVEKDEFEALKAVADSTRRLIAGFIGYLRKTSIRGAKYK